jgi:hypothetical protein
LAIKSATCHIKQFNILRHTFFNKPAWTLKPISPGGINVLANIGVLPKN